jgi:hypothetical protein
LNVFPSGPWYHAINLKREGGAPEMSTLYTLLFMVLLGGAACIKR